MLAGMPQVSPDLGVFFDSPEHTRLTDLSCHLAENSADVVLLLGEKGAGKTTFLYRITSMAPAHWAICRVDANPMMRPDQMLAGLARCVSAPVDTQESTSVLNAAFSALRLQGRLPVVVVDDAGQLPMAALMTLVRLHESTGESVPPFALILMAEPSIEQTLATQQFHAMGTARFNRLEIPRLDHSQIAAYIRHYLRMEGVEQDLKLSKAQLQRIHQNSAGLPGKVNDLVVQVLHDPEHGRGFPLATAALGRLSAIPPMTSVAFSGLIVVLAVSLIFQEEINRLFEKPEPPVQQLKEPSGLPFRQLDESESGRQVMALPLPAQKTDVMPDSEAQVDKTEAVTGTGQGISLRGDVAAKGLASHWQSAQIPDSKVSNTEPEAEPEPEAEIVLLPDSTPDQVEGSTAAPDRSMVEDVVQSEKTRPDFSPMLKLDSELKPKPPSRSNAQPSSRSGKSVQSIKSQAWLTAQRPESYTLQIIGVSDEQAALQFIRSRKFKAEVVYYESRRNGRPWFSVLHGVYPDRDAAMAAIEHLPASLRKIGAWPRSLGSVQADMKGH